jgi:excinuclease ABC subunit C
VVHPRISDVDVYSIISDATHAYVNYMQVSHGLVVRSHTLEIRKKLEESDEDLLALAVMDIRERFESTCKEVYLPFRVPLSGDIQITVPKLGDKRKLVELSERNARFYRQERFKQIRITDPDRHTKRLMDQMKKDLRLPQEPTHIECFDNSNIQGTNPVAACVVFRNGKPSKKEYRHFNIRTVTGPDDFASMEEVVFRRYRRLLDEGEDLPQLIVIDGGKGQLSAALKSLEQLGLRGRISIIGIAKRLEEIYFPADPIPLYLDKKSETLRIVQQLRNEAHRFGITFHRKKRSKAAISSALEGIDGIGEKTAGELLRKFKSVKRIREASLEDLAAVIGPSKARKVYESLRE